MVYYNQFVAAAKCNGKVLRESRSGDNSTAHLPFGTEYSVFLKNMSNRKVLVSVKIDGRSAIDELIVRANSSIDLERFFEGDMSSGHRFKFIEKTEKVSEHRGDKPEDGLIEIRYKFEKEIVRVEKIYNHDHDHYHLVEKIYNHDHNHYHPQDQWSSLLYSRGIGTSTTAPSAAVASYDNDHGITVEGSQSSQSFVYGNIGELETQEHVIIIQLRGVTTEDKPIEQPVTVRSKIECKYCGTKNFSGNKFCRECGAAVI